MTCKLRYDPAGGFTCVHAYDFKDNTLFTGHLDDVQMEKQLDKDSFDRPSMRHLVDNTFLMIWRSEDRDVLHCIKLSVRKR